MAAPPQIEPAAAVPLTTETPQPNLLDSIIDQQTRSDAGFFMYAEQIAKAAASSGYFDDATRISQAQMKILVGRALGIEPAIALMHVHIIKGKVALDGNLIATKLRQNGYTWKVLQQDENGCELLFFRNGQMMTAVKRTPNGFEDTPLTVAFTRKHAEDADLAGPRGKEKDKGMYEKYPRNLFFNRCITNFQKWHAPEVSNGITVYTADELESVPAESTPAVEMPRRQEVTA